MSVGASSPGQPSLHSDDCKVGVELGHDTCARYLMVGKQYESKPVASSV